MKTKLSFLFVAGILTLMLGFTFKPDVSKRVIVIDAGHGGSDGGAKFEGVLEKNLTESIARKIILLNDKSDLEIILLRDGDETISVKDRVTRINNLKPDLVLSIHIGAATNSEQNGVEALVSPENSFYSKSKEVAQDLIKKVSGNELSKGQVVESGRSYLIKSTQCPSLILNTGFLSNEKDRKYISSEDGQNQIAGRIYEVIR